VSQTSPSPNPLQTLLQTILHAAPSIRSEQTGVETEEEEPIVSFLFDIPPQYFSTSSESTNHSPSIPRQNRAPVRMSQRQILDKTRVFTFSEDTLTNTTCPISHVEFKTGDILCEIKKCHHIFQYVEIMKWLDINSTCPICRTHLLEETI